MKAILFVILNVSVCFPRGLVGVEILIPGGFGGLNEKKFPGSLSLAMTPLQHTFNFYPGCYTSGNGRGLFICVVPICRIPLRCISKIASASMSVIVLIHNVSFAAFALCLLKSEDAVVCRDLATHHWVGRRSNLWVYNDVDVRSRC